MKCYGFYDYYSKNNYLRNYKRKINLRARTAGILLTFSSRYKIFRFVICVPSLFKFVVFKQEFFFNYCYLSMFAPFYSANFSLSLEHSKVFVDDRVKAIFFDFKFFNNYINIYRFFFQLSFFSYVQFFFNKIKFRGKGYYVYKNYRNIIAFQFGFSHRVKIYLFFVKVKFLSKTSVLIFGLNKLDILKASNLFVKKRPINVFTGRGARFSRQLIYRKSGKISTYR